MLILACRFLYQKWSCPQKAPLVDKNAAFFSRVASLDLNWSEFNWSHSIRCVVLVFLNIPVIKFALQFCPVITCSRNLFSSLFITALQHGWTMLTPWWSLDNLHILTLTYGVWEVLLLQSLCNKSATNKNGPVGWKKAYLRSWSTIRKPLTHRFPFQTM